MQFSKQTRTDMNKKILAVLIALSLLMVLISYLSIIL